MNEFSGVELIRAMMAKPSPFQDNFKKIVVSPNTLGEIRYSLLINKNSQWAGLVPRINATLEAIKRDGTYDRILKRYLTLEGQ
jgi:ABC-type amino acid transport substrate-binding protein